MVLTKGYGYSIHDLEMTTPSEMAVFEKAWENQQKVNDLLMWQMGFYVNSAVAIAIDQCFNGKKSKSRYFEEPMFNKALEESKLTQEEIDERELRKMLANEKAWQLNDQLRGLPKASEQIKATD